MCRKGLFCSFRVRVPPQKLSGMSMCAGDRVVARRGIFSSVKDIEVSPRTASVSGDYWQAQFRECFGHVVIVSAAGYPHLGGAMTLIA